MENPVEANVKKNNFFENNIKDLEVFQEKASLYLNNYDGDKGLFSLHFKLNSCVMIIGMIIREPEAWSENCSFSIDHIGSQFIDTIRSVNSMSGFPETSLIELYLPCFRFLCNFDFNIQSIGGDASHLLDVIPKDPHLDELAGKRIHYAQYQMPVAIMKDMLDKSGLHKSLGLNSTIEKAIKLKQQWDDEIEAKETKVDNLKRVLEKYTSSYNFVGIYKGFFDLAETKKTEGRWLLASIIMMAFLIISIPVFQVILSVYSLNNMAIESNVRQVIQEEKLDISNGNRVSQNESNVVGEDENTSNTNDVNNDDHVLGFNANQLSIILPMISIEILLIYFFRILLMNHRSIKAQLIQIELRKSLCQFIESYIESTAGIKKEDASAFDKFESVVFSGITADLEKVPTTFDGIDDLSKLLSSFKSKSNSS